MKNVEVIWNNEEFFWGLSNTKRIIFISLVVRSLETNRGWPTIVFQFLLLQCLRGFVHALKMLLKCCQYSSRPKIMWKISLESQIGYSLFKYIFYHLEKWDSNRYLRVFFFPQKSKICNFFLSMRCMAMGVSAFDNPDLGAPFKYHTGKHILLSSRKFFRVFWSRRNHWKMRKSQIKFRNFEMNLWKILKKYIFPNF